MEESGSDSFVDDILFMQEIYEQVQQKFQLDQHVSAIQLLKDHSDLFSRNWQTSLGMTALSHDMLSTSIILADVISRYKEDVSHDLYVFLRNLDRLIEIDVMQQIGGIILVEKNHKFMHQIAKMKLTRYVINHGIVEKLGYVPEYKSTMPSYIGFH